LWIDQPAWRIRKALAGGPSADVLPVFYVAEDGATQYVTEDGVAFYITEDN
jgi:hypothetical protein